MMAGQETLPTPDSTPQQPEAATEDTLESPLQTLLKSLRRESTKGPTLADVADAYDTISTRIRKHSSAFEDPRQARRLLKPLHHNILALVGCLRRDISRGKNHLSEQHIPDQVPRADEQGSTANPEENLDSRIKHSLESLNCCYSSVKLLSLIFRMPSLQSIFAPNNLGSLLDVLLDVVLERQMRAINGRKTFELVMWTLQTLQLPSAILSPKADRMCQALESTLLLEKIEDDIATFTVCGGLKVIHDLLVHHQHIMLAPLAGLLPGIFSHLCSAVPEVRMQVAVTLGRFAVCLLYLTGSSAGLSAQLRLGISDSTNVYMTLQWRKYGKLLKDGLGSQTGDISAAITRTLPNLIISAFSNARSDDNTELDRSLLWAASVLSSLIVLIDGHLYRHPSPLRMVFSCIEPLHATSHGAAKELHPLIRKCTIWAYSRVDVDASYQSQDDTDGQISEGALAMMREDLGRGIGLALVATLSAPTLKHGGETLPESSEGSHIDTRPIKRIDKMLAIIADMVEKKAGGRTSVGLSVLRQLLGTVGFSFSWSNASDAIPWTTVKLVERKLLDGTLFKANDSSKLCRVLHKLNALPLDIVPPLSETEIVEYWDQLFVIWVSAVEMCMLNDSQEQALRDVEFVWQSLLLVQAQLTQEHGHLTAESNLVNQIVNPFKQFLALTATLPNKMVYAHRLLQRIWIVVTNVFTAPWLPNTARAILMHLLRMEIPADNQQVKAAFHQFCRALLYCGAPTLVQSIVEQTNLGDDEAQKRELWTLLVREWPNIQSNLQDTIRLAGIPLRCWDMKVNELMLWDSLLQFVIAQGRSSSKQASDVLNEISTAAEYERIVKLSCMPQVICILLSHADLSNAGDIPVNLFSLVDRLLAELYKPRSARTPLSSDPLRILSDVIKTCPPRLVPKLINTMNFGLLEWIRDERSLMLEDEYNGTVIPLYSETLTALASLPPTIELLESAAEFIAAGFYRMPPPGLGPEAFRSFWEPKYSGIQNIEENCPEPLKFYLAALFGLHSPGASSQSSQMPRYDDESARSAPLIPPERPTPISHQGAASQSPARSFFIQEHYDRRVGSSSPFSPSQTRHAVEDISMADTRVQVLTPELRHTTNAGSSNIAPDSAPISIEERDMPPSSPLPSSPMLSSRRQRLDTQESVAGLSSGNRPLVLQYKDDNPKRAFAFPAPPSSSGGFSAYSSYQKSGPRIKGSDIGGNRLDFSSIATPTKNSPGIFGKRLMREPSRDALPLASPFVERPSKRVRIEDEPSPGSSLASRNGETSAAGQVPEVSDVIESSSGWAEMPPTQETEMSQILTAWDRTRADHSNIADVSNSSSVYLGDGPSTRRSQTAPAGATRPSSPPAQSLRRSLSSPAPPTSSQLETLRNTITRISSGVSDMPAQEVLDAQKLINDFGYLLNDRLRRILGGLPK